ncbi:MAG: peptidoglycan DD-metalloendopeptidase family protein [Candidatus Saganbacteria bacterium]|nr:peptidoglycan DD-metalloendopeptidase family protein [Candidatus Saganbacteria bacterium]
MQKEYFTFILIPHSSNKPTISLKVPRWLVHVVMFVFVTSVVVLVSSLVYSSHVTRKIVSYEDFKSKAAGQSKEVDKYSKKTDDLALSLREIDEKQNQIRKLLGLQERPSKISLIKDENAVNRDIGHKLNFLEKNVKESSNNIKELESLITEFRKRFANTPSIWPAYGKIVSKFGYRVFPWPSFHSGVDIDAHYGDAVRSSADGVVSYAGWRSGYGRTVVIDHHFGIETLYGHLSSFIVTDGQKVKKGQKIAYVGMTGSATGPHLHYEVIRNGAKINPIAYLNLSIINANIGR